MVQNLIELYKENILFEQGTVLLVGALATVAFGFSLYTFFDFFAKLVVMTH